VSITQTTSLFEMVSTGYQVVANALESDAIIIAAITTSAAVTSLLFTLSFHLRGYLRLIVTVLNAPSPRMALIRHVPVDSPFVDRLNMYWQLVASYRNRVPTVAAEVETGSMSSPEMLSLSLAMVMLATAVLT